MDAREVDNKRFPPRMIQSIISRAKNQLENAAQFAQHIDGVVDEVVAAVYETYERRLREMNAMDFDDLLLRSVELFQTYPDVLDQVPERLPADPRRRVPGHQLRAVQVGRADGARAPQPRGGRRRRPVDLRLPRRGRAATS